MHACVALLNIIDTAFSKPAISSIPVELQLIRQTWTVSRLWRCRSNHSSGTSLSSARDRKSALRKKARGLKTVGWHSTSSSFEKRPCCSCCQCLSRRLVGQLVLHCDRFFFIFIFKKKLVGEPKHLITPQATLWPQRPGKCYFSQNGSFKRFWANQWNKSTHPFIHWSSSV